MSSQDEEASLCLKAASHRSVRSSTNPIPLTVPNLFRWAWYRRYKYQIHWAQSPGQTSGQHISPYQAETLWCAFAPITRIEFLGLWAGLHLSRWLMLALQSFSRPINPQGRMQQGSRDADYSRPLRDFPQNQLHFCLGSSSGLCRGSRRRAV